MTELKGYLENRTQLFGRKELDRLINPSSIAIIGASETAGSFGARTMRGLNVERLCLSAAASGNSHRIIDSALGFARQRTQFGKPITDYQAISHKLADMRITAEISRVMAYRLGSLMDKGVAPNTAAAVTKIFATEGNSKCADMGIQVMGGAGLMMNSEMQMYFRDSRVGTIGGGTSEILRNVIAKSMI